MHFDFLIFQKISTGGGCYDPWEGAVMARKFGIIEAPLPELKNQHNHLPSFSMC